MRIGIAGCAGTGKSFLAWRISKEIGIPFLPSKSITGNILRRDGYDFASGEQVEKFLSTPERQAEILEKTSEQHGSEEYVTDRTAVDLAAYAILEMKGALNVQKYVDECCKLAEFYTHLFLCPWEHCDIIDNNKRTLDPWYQMAVHAVEIEVFKMFGVDFYVIPYNDVEERVAYVMSCLDIE